MSQLLHTSTVHKTASQAGRGQFCILYCQSSGAHNMKHINLCKLTLRGHLNADAQARDRTRNVLLTRTMPYATAPRVPSVEFSHIQKSHIPFTVVFVFYDLDTQNH